MPLAHDITTIRDRALTELNAAHDYYADTKIAWQLVERLIAGGRKLRIRNKTTGTVTTEAELTGRVRGYVAERLAEATFQTFLAVFEAFLGDLLRARLRAEPKYLMPTEPVDFPTIHAAPDKAAVIDFVVERKVQGLFYKRPADWLKFADDKLGLGCPTADEVERLAEAKATRDVLIHNRGVANEVYVDKSGRRARFRVGDRVDVPEPYHREVWELLRKVVAELSDAMTRKFP